MKHYFVLFSLIISFAGFSQTEKEVRSFTKAKLAEVKLVSELSSDLPRDMEKVSVEMVYKVRGKIHACGFTGDTLGTIITRDLKVMDNHSKIYFDIKAWGPKPKTYTFAILVVD